MFDTINPIVSPAYPHVPVFSKTDSNDFLHFFVNKIRDISFSISPSICLNAVSDRPPPYIWSAFEPMTLHNVTVLLNKMKPTSCPTDVLITALLKKVFHSTGVVHRFFKHAIVEPIKKNPVWIHHSQKPTGQFLHYSTYPKY